jgi:superfamily II DNA/RNA helicase
MGFEGPTLVQAKAIPVVLSGRHAYPFFLIFTACFDTVILLNL